jgi:hypothetical protein
VNQLQLNQIIEHIDHAFGEELPFSGRDLNGQDREVLKRVFGDEGYQAYLQDQVNRQIIRDYLTNAVMLGYVPEQTITGFASQLGSREERAALSLHMLMSAVEQASELLATDSQHQLKILKPGPGAAPFMTLIKS